MNKVKTVDERLNGIDFSGNRVEVSTEEFVALNDEVSELRAAYEALQKENAELKEKLRYSVMAADAEARFADEYKAKFEAKKQRAYALALVINDLTRMRTFEGETKEDFIKRVKSILSVNPDLRVCELQKENAELKATISNLTKAYERESNDGLKALEERDYWYNKADSLADKISECFDVPIGEHSNVNCPIVEAMKILTGEYVTKFDKESAAQAKRIDNIKPFLLDCASSDFVCTSKTLRDKANELLDMFNGE